MSAVVADPAVEAVNKVLGNAKYSFAVRAVAVDSVREALKPIRARHYRVLVDDNNAPVCASCWGPNGPKDWPCPDALDVYATEELES